MVATLVQNSGKVADLFAMREVEAGCLCLKTDKRGEREYKAVVEVNPINFSLMSEGEQESILESFRIFLQRLTVRQPLSIHIRIESYDIEPYLVQLHQAAHDESPALRMMAEDHEQFILRLASQRSLLQRFFYVIVGAEREKGRFLDRAEVFDRAKSTLDLKCKDILQDMERCGLSAHRLNDDELTLYYQSCLHNSSAKESPLTTAVIKGAHRPLQQPATALIEASDLADEEMKEEVTEHTPEPVQETPVSKRRNFFFREARKAKTIKLPADMGLPEMLAPASVELDRNYIRIHRHSTDEYIRGLAVVGYPAIVNGGWLDRLVQIDEPNIEIMLHLENFDSADYTQKLSRKLSGFSATQMLEKRHGKTADPWIKAAKNQVEELRDELVAQTEKVFGVSLYLMARASDKQQLKTRIQKLMSLLKSLELVAVDTQFEHHKLWQCFLPDGRDILKRRKTLDTSSMLTGFPFASSSLSTPTGTLVGIMPNGSLVIIDPKSELLENGHEVKFARSGAGKSYDEKVRVSRALLAGYKAIVIDPENEYLPLCRQFDGKHILLSDGSLRLNPFDLPLVSDGGERKILDEKLQSLHALFDLMLAEKIPGTLTQREKGYLNKCFYQVYADKGITSDPRTHTKQAPCMEDLFEVIQRGVCGPDTFDLANRLERYLPAFPRETTVNLDNRLIAFGIRDLADELRAIGLFLVTDFVWTQIRRERLPAARLLVVDEAWKLMQFSEGGKFLAGISRRARKYNLCLRTITQDCEDFLNSEWGRTILVNSSMKFLMKQDTSTIDSVSKAFRLSDGERKYLMGCGKGEGLFFARNSHVPLKVVASPVEHKLATTNAEELLQREREQAAELQESEAAEEALTTQITQKLHNVSQPLESRFAETTS